MSVREIVLKIDNLATLARYALLSGDAEKRAEAAAAIRADRASATEERHRKVWDDLEIVVATSLLREGQGSVEYLQSCGFGAQCIAASVECVQMSEDGNATRRKQESCQ